MNEHHDYRYFLDKEFKNWNPKQYEWSREWILPNSCSKYFEIWWDPNRFHTSMATWSLAGWCSEYFEIWWDPDKFHWDNYFQLVNKCQQYKHIWYPDYLIHKLINNKKD